MGEMIDAVNPANIGAGWDGRESVRITVLANQAGQMFDIEGGDAPASEVAKAVRARYDQEFWSGAYVNEANSEQAIVDIGGAGVPLRTAHDWPQAGFYLWCADPSGNIARGNWRLPVQPIAIQDRYPGPYDLSTTYGGFTAQVAGYIDGAQSAWPPGAWARFKPTPDRAPPPPPNQGPDTVAVVCEIAPNGQPTFYAIIHGRRAQATAIWTQ